MPCADPDLTLKNLVSLDTVLSLGSAVGSGFAPVTFPACFAKSGTSHMRLEGNGRTVHGFCRVLEENEQSKKCFTSTILAPNCAS